MYLHLGSDCIVYSKDIVGVFDIENTTTSKITRDFLSKGTKLKRVINVTNELPKSFVVTENKNHEITIYITQVSVTTLLKRSNNSSFIIEL